jgi:hypothetical protein
LRAAAGTTSSAERDYLLAQAARSPMSTQAQGGGATPSKK